MFSFIICTSASITYAMDSSQDPSAGNITVTNNVGKPDTVYISGLNSGDLVKVYNASSGGRLLTTGRVTLYGSDVTISMAQLGSSAGSVYISVTSTGMAESNRIEADYDAEPISDIPNVSNVTITNNANMRDIVDATGIPPGTIVKVYSAAVRGRLLGNATAGSNYEAIVYIPKLGVASGSTYISLTEPGELESPRTEVDYAAEITTTAPNAANITVTNNAGSPDTIYINQAIPGETVRVYSQPQGGTLIASTMIGTNKTDATITIPQLGMAAGSVYVSLTAKGDTESNRVEADYVAEGTTNTPNVGNISVNNTVGMANTVYVTSLSPGDVVKAYNAATGGIVIGSGTVQNYKVDLTFNVSQLNDNGGNIYVSVTSKGMGESARNAS